MTVLRSNPVELPREHERVFAERYAEVVGWALKLTNGDQPTAHDLAHDAFMLFTLVRPDLSVIHNVDAYLYTLLRNLHISYLRKASREMLQSVSLEEFDSIRQALSTSEHVSSVSVQNELRQICAFACRRKEATKSASVLILRFFYDYLPNEVADIALLNVSAVYNRLLAARKEIAKAKRSQWEMSGAGTLPSLQIHAVPVDALLAELRNMLFAARSGECLPAEELLGLYRRSLPVPITSTLLAHLVSCERCLDLLNDLMKRPHTHQRVPGESMDREDPRNARDTHTTKRSIHHVIGRSSALNEQRRRLLAGGMRRREEVYQHRPAQLCIAVNGELQASHTIQAETSELKSHIDYGAHVEFVEVFSEQGVRLLLANVGNAPPQGPHERHFAVKLSEGRLLELFLAFSSQGLSVEVRYHDPEFARIEAAEIDERRDAIVIMAAPERTQAEPVPVQSVPAVLTRLGRALRYLLPSPGWIVATALAICAVFGLFFYRHQAPTRIDAADLLTRAVVREQGAVAAERAEHRSLRIEKMAADGVVVERGHTDVWREQAKLARRFYDEQDHLLAGEWRDGQHAWSYGKAGGLQARNQLDASPVPVPDDVWQVEPSADVFSRTAAHAESMHVTETAADYRIEASLPASSISAPHLVGAALVLERKTLHAQSETLWFSNGESYRIVEASYDQPRISDVGPDIFRPDSSLRRHRPSDTLSLPGHASVDGPGVIRLELHVLAALSGIGADVGDSIDVTRESSGHGRIVRVSGIADTSERKEQILAALASLVASRSLEISLLTPDEAGTSTKRRRHLPPPTSIRVFDASEGGIPAYDELRSYFGRQGFQGQELEDHIQSFCFAVLGQSSSATQQAWAMQRLTDAFAPDELARLDDDSRTVWLRMLEAHAREFNRNVKQLQTSLALIYPDVAIHDTEHPAAQPNEPETLAGLTAATQTIFNQAIKDDETIRSAFSHNNSPERAAALKTAQFHTSLAQTQQAAAAVFTITGKLESWASLHSDPQKQP